MLIEIARGLVLILGLTIVVLCLFGLGALDRLIAIVRGVADRPWGLAFAVVVRLILGAALIFAAPSTRFPLAFEILGWVALAAAVALPIMGAQRMRALVEWVERWPQALTRVWLVFGAVFGAFLVYGIG